MRLVTALAVLVVLSACGGANETTDRPEASATESGSVAPREPAPAIEGSTLDGERLALADFRGRPVFVLVWSSW